MKTLAISADLKLPIDAKSKARRETSLGASANSAKCELPITGYGGRNAGREACNKPAFYWWAPRSQPARMQRMCREHGELTAGNHTDELVPISRRATNIQLKPIQENQNIP